MRLLHQVELYTLIMAMVWCIRPKHLSINITVIYTSILKGLMVRWPNAEYIDWLRRHTCRTRTTCLSYVIRIMIRVIRVYPTSNGGTTSSNTREAFADGLIKNDKGHDDSQSIPVCCFDSTTKEFLCCYGSVSEAHRATGITKTGILNQCNNRPAKGFRKGLVFRYMSDYPDNIFVL